MRFEMEQVFDAPPDAVAAAYADPGLYASFEGLPKMTAPDVLSHEVDGDEVHMRIRYRFAGDLSPAARAVIDPAKLTWVEHSTHDLAARRTTFEMHPDHYADRFSCRGSYRFEPRGAGCVRLCEGAIKVRALLVAGAVEGAIVSGLREHLADEVAAVEAFLAGDA